MYIINVALITAIIFSFILSLFSIMLMLSSNEKKKNFLFSENFALQVNGSDLTKISSGLIFGGSIFLGTLLIWLWYQYNYSKWEATGKDKVKHYQTNRGHITKALEWVIIVAILFLIIGIAIFSYDLFDKIIDYQLETIETVSLWVIFILGIITFSLALAVILYLTMEERKPNVINNKDEQIMNFKKSCRQLVELFGYTQETQKINNQWKDYIYENYPRCDKKYKDKLIRILSAKYPNEDFNKIGEGRKKLIKLDDMLY